MRRRVDAVLTPLVLASLAVLLSSAALRAGLIGDDHFHRMVLRGTGPLAHFLDPTFDLFSFVTRETGPTMTDLGLLPWWSDPTLRVALGRPLSALTHRADYALWPDDFVLQHLHSLLWLGLGVGLVAGLYRKVHGAGATAALAGLLFAVEDAHAWPAGWLANRNALLCLVAGTAVILLHLSWSRTRRRSHLVAALAALAVGLGCGEATLGGLAYVAAWQLTEERGSWASWLAPLLPYGGVVVAWRILYDRAGYGTQGSTLYLDPSTQPLHFLAALGERWPLMVTAQWLQVPVDLWLMLTRSHQLCATACAALATVGLLAVLWKLLRAERLARFWLSGMALSLVPVCAAFPMDRLLVFSGIGAFGSLALLLQHVGVWPWGAMDGRGWRRRAALVLLGIHLPLAAVLLVGRTALLPVFGRFFALAERSLPTSPELAGQTVVFVNGNDFPVAYSWFIRTAEGEPSAPKRVALLSSMSTSSIVCREDAATLLISPDRGFLLLPIDRLLASATRTFAVGEEVVRPDFAAEIRSLTLDGRPRQVAFRFRHALEDAAYHWVSVDNRVGFVPFPLPSVGECVTLGAVSLE